jgi:hypothetical protein
MVIRRADFQLQHIPMGIKEWTGMRLPAPFPRKLEQKANINDSTIGDAVFTLEIQSMISN